MCVHAVYRMLFRTTTTPTFFSFLLRTLLLLLLLCPRTNAPTWLPMRCFVIIFYSDTVIILILFFTCKKKPFNIFNGRQPSTPESVNSFLSFLFLFLVRMYHLSRRLRRWFLTCISTKRCCTDCVLHFSKVLFPPLQKLRRSETLNALLSRRIGEAVTQ